MAKECNHLMVRSSRSLLVCYGVFGLLVVAGVGALLVGFIVVYREFKLSNGFKESLCYMVYNETLLQQTCESCKFLFNCYESSFPCQQVTVRYTTDDGYETRGVAFSSAKQMDGQYAHCSHSHCDSSEETNEDKIDDYVLDWTHHYTAPRRCYYNPHNHTQVLDTIKYSRGEAIHSLTWPTVLVLVLVSAGVVYLYLWKRNKKRLQTMQVSETPRSSIPLGDVTGDVTAGTSSTVHVQRSRTPPHNVLWSQPRNMPHVSAYGNAMYHEQQHIPPAQPPQVLQQTANSSRSVLSSGVHIYQPHTHMAHSATTPVLTITTVSNSVAHNASPVIQTDSLAHGFSSAAVEPPVLRASSAPYAENKSW